MKMKTGRDIELGELVSHQNDNHQLMNGGAQLREDPEDEKRKKFKGPVLSLGFNYQWSNYLRG